MSSHFNILGTVAESLTPQTSDRGTTWANLLVTVQRRCKDKDSAWKEDADNVSMPVFGKRAEWLAMAISEGDRVFITGRIGGEIRERNGRTFYDTKLWIDDVKPLGQPEGAQRASIEEQGTPASRDHPPQQLAQVIHAGEGDGTGIPF